MKTGFGNNHNFYFYAVILAITLAMLACGFAGYTINLTDEPVAQPSVESTASAECIKGIFPGKTTKDEVMTLFGYPLAAQQEGDLEILQYASSMYGQSNSVTVQSGVVALVSVVQGEDQPLEWSTVKAQFGEPTHTAYSNYLQGSMTFGFPAQGRAFIADENLDVVFIQQCFVPMSLENYMLVYGNFLPLEDPFIK